jgi:hypothetical protein
MVRTPIRAFDGEVLTGHNPRLPRLMALSAEITCAKIDRLAVNPQIKCGNGGETVVSVGVCGVNLVTGAAIDRRGIVKSL